MTIGQRIAALRTSFGLTQEQLGEKLGTTRQTVSKWELDQTLPELEKIVRISRLFSVTTDSLLVDGISTFEDTDPMTICGVYRSPTAEIVETEQFALRLECGEGKNPLWAVLYHGIGDQKRLCGICRWDQTERRIAYAYLAYGKAYSNEAGRELADRLGERYDPAQKDAMRRLERFTVDHTGAEMPKVSEGGISGCLRAWRMSDSYHASADEMSFFLYTGQTEYVFSIQREDDNVYCGASYNLVFDLGLFGADQYFRIRNFRDNREPWCRFFCDFGRPPRTVSIPTQSVRLGECVQTPEGFLWCVKRYTDDEIVLQGCGDDEYVSRRLDQRDEIFQSGDFDD